MPVALLRTEPSRAFAPLAARKVSLGSDPSCDIVDRSPGVAPVHARLRYVKGEWLFTSEDDQRVEVGGETVPMMTLRPGDVLRLAPEGAAWTFRNRLANAFVPPGMSIAAAWQAHPEFNSPDHGPASCTDAAWVVKPGAPCRRPEDADRHLTLLARIGGASHPALARLVDGGLHAVDGATNRWLATRYVEGTVVRDALSPAGLSAARVLSVLQPLAAALEHLHARGVIHRDVAPGNAVLTTGGAVLIDYGQAVLADEALASSAGVVGTPGYVAPEEVLEGPAGVTPAIDVYGLCAVGYAMLTGGPPASGEHVLDALSRAARPPISPRELGVDVPELLESLLLRGLEPDPAKRPDAAGVRAALDAAEASLGSKGRV